MNRRGMVFALTALSASPLATFAQQSGKVWRVGLLHLSTQPSIALRLDAFKQAFRDLGYVEGRDYVLEMRFADNHGDRLQTLASELVKSGPDLILASPASPTLAMQKATSTIPIVMITAGDPVGSGLVKSLAHPGGNVTGTSNSLTDVSPKHLDLLHELLPRVSRLALLMNSNYPSHRAVLKTMQSLAARIGVQIVPIEAQSAPEIENGFSEMKKQNAGAVVVVTDSIYIERRRQIAEMAVKDKLPSIGFNAEEADAGYLISYGPNSLAIYRRTAFYVDKILKGAKPAELPVEQPTTFELAINLKTAKALGIAIPQSILLRADRVIE